MSNQAVPPQASSSVAGEFRKDLFEIMDGAPPPNAMDAVEYTMLRLMALQIRVALAQMEKR